MHTYMFNNIERIWTVGFFDPSNTHFGVVIPRWHPLADFQTENEARKLVHYLNGGTRERQDI